MNKTKENNKRGMKPLKQKCEVKLNDFVRYQNGLSNRIIQTTKYQAVLLHNPY